jgi:hypothetical protein
MPIHPQTIYTKTAKGILDVKNKTVKLSREASQVFNAVDGKSTVAEILQKLEMDASALDGVLEQMSSDGFIRAFFTPPEKNSEKSSPAEVVDELDFTSSEAISYNLFRSCSSLAWTSAMGPE